MGTSSGFSSECGPPFDVMRSALAPTKVSTLFPLSVPQRLPSELSTTRQLTRIKRVEPRGGWTLASGPKGGRHWVEYRHHFHSLSD
jgi:hypothetical protein